MVLKSICYDRTWNPSLQRAQELMPAAFRRPCTCPTYVGIEPQRTELFNYNTELDDGRTLTPDVPVYDQVAHVVYSKPNRDPAIIIPHYRHHHSAEWDLYTWVHEMGHVLHARVWSADLSELPDLTHYAATNNLECFAEAFTYYVLGEKLFWSQRAWDALDKNASNVHKFFDSLQREIQS